MPTGSAPCAAGCCALSRLGNTRRYSSRLDREKGKHARGLFPPGASTCGDSVPAQRGVSACAGTVSEWPLADCGQRMQPLSSVAYNWPPRPHQSCTSLSTPLSVSQPGHSPLFGGPNDATLLFEFGNSRACPSLLHLDVPRSLTERTGGSSCRSSPLLFLLNEQLRAPDRGDHAATAALVAGLGPKWKAACNRAFALAKRAIMKLGVNFTFTWHVASVRSLVPDLSPCRSPYRQGAGSYVISVNLGSDRA
jgi:hypothetical protein